MLCCVIYFFFYIHINNVWIYFTILIKFLWSCCFVGKVIVSVVDASECAAVKNATITAFVKHASVCVQSGMCVALWSLCEKRPVCYSTSSQLNEDMQEN